MVHMVSHFQSAETHSFTHFCVWMMILHLIVIVFNFVKNICGISTVHPYCLSLSLFHRHTHTHTLSVRVYRCVTCFGVPFPVLLSFSLLHSLTHPVLSPALLLVFPSVTRSRSTSSHPLSLSDHLLKNEKNYLVLRLQFSFPSILICSIFLLRCLFLSMCLFSFLSLISSFCHCCDFSL